MAGLLAIISVVFPVDGRTSRLITTHPSRSPPLASLTQSSRYVGYTGWNNPHDQQVGPHDHDCICLEQRAGQRRTSLKIYCYWRLGQ